MHGDDNRGIGGKTDLVKYPPSPMIMVDNDWIWLLGQPYHTDMQGEWDVEGGINIKKAEQEEGWTRILAFIK